MAAVAPAAMPGRGLKPGGGKIFIVVFSRPGSDAGARIETILPVPATGWTLESPRQRCRGAD
jgi:hypothetical protein